jgi:hypothetical protein
MNNKDNTGLSVEELSKVFNNNFDCYTERKTMMAFDELPAMTERKFIEVVSKLLSVEEENVTGSN